MNVYRYRNALNIEYLEVLGLFLTQKEINCCVIICDQETYEVEQAEFEEFSHLIIETVDNTRRETKEQIVKIEKTLNDKMGTMDKRMQNVEKYMEDI